MKAGSWRVGSTAKSTPCFGRGPGFESQHLCGSSNLIASLAPKDPPPLLLPLLLLLPIPTPRWFPQSPSTLAFQRDYSKIPQQTFRRGPLLQVAILPRGRPGRGLGRGNPHAPGAARHRGRGLGRGLGVKNCWKRGNRLQAGIGDLAREERRRCRNEGSTARKGERLALREK